jgi:predicted N-acetyltransferase YhbS
LRNTAVKGLTAVKGVRNRFSFSVPDPFLQVVGRIAFSPVQIDGASTGWHGLGPVAVRPKSQRQGIGSALIHAGLERQVGESKSRDSVVKAFVPDSLTGTLRF